MTVQRSRPAHYVQLMKASAAQAECYIDGMSREDFFGDARTQDAVIMKLLVIGELSARLLDEHADFVSRYPSVPWRQMKGMRNRMAHGYFERDLNVVWDTVAQALPQLRAELDRIAP